MPEALVIPECDRSEAAPPADAALSREDPAENARWDAELAACPGASFFHSAAWARTLAGAYGFQPVYFTLRSEGRLRAVLPLMEVDSWLTGRRGISLPFTDECAGLAGDAASFDRLVGAALERARLRGWKYLELRSGRAPGGPVPVWSSFLGHRLDLRGGEDALFARLHGSVRSAVRKAGRSGLKIEFSQEPAAVRDFHRLLCQTRQRHGLPPQPYSFFASIQRNVLAPNLGWVVLARHGNVPVAGAVYFRFGRTAIYKYGASDMNRQELRANNLVMWEAIRRHAAEGFETLDFGRTDPDNEGLRKYKLGWGTTECRIDYVRHIARLGAFAGPAGAAPAWQTAVFRRLPNPLLQLIGTALYRHAA